MKLLILGASVRAAAFSALRAGVVPLGVDLFADRDLAAVAECRRVPRESYPRGLFETDLIDRADAWIYTGALENRPLHIDRLARRVPLKGIPGPRLRQVRNPFVLGAVLRADGFSFPESRKDLPSIEETDWLVKPYRSGGGLGIARRGAPTSRPSSRTYYQKALRTEDPLATRGAESGAIPLSAVFLSDSRKASLQGITLQSIGHPGAPFGYRGSLGPWPITEAARRRVAELGDCIARRFGLRGIFGIDILLLDEEPWAVEVNPRYTASVEVLELACGRSILAGHLAIFAGDACPDAAPAEAQGFVAKEVVFAESESVFDGYKLEAEAFTDPYRLPDFADIPEDGTRFSEGEPIATIFGQGTTIEECRSRLERSREVLMSHRKPSI